MGKDKNIKRGKTERIRKIDPTEWSCSDIWHPVAWRYHSVVALGSDLPGPPAGRHFYTYTLFYRLGGFPVFSFNLFIIVANRMRSKKVSFVPSSSPS